MPVQQESDVTKLFAFLNRERLYAAYAIGDLEPSMFRDCQWYMAHAAGQDGVPLALGLLFSGFRVPILFMMGDVSGVEDILARSLHPPVAYFNCRAEHLPAVTDHYDLSNPQEMWRMALATRDFVPCETRLSPVRLHSRDIGALNELYDLAQAEHFAAYQVEQGIFYGLHVDGMLVATAGTHVVSQTYDIAAVGNVFTHPHHRGRGYAMACTDAVVREIVHRGCQDVVLNVNVANAVAIHVYERLGFRRHCRYLEGLGKHRRSGLLTRLGWQ